MTPPLNESAYPPSYEGAGIILQNPYKEVLIVRDKRSGKWSFPKGKVESYDKNTPLNTAMRECEEETGLLEGRDYTFTESTPAFVYFDRFYYLAAIHSDAEARIHIDGEEIAAYMWLNPRKSCSFWVDLNSSLRNYVKRETMATNRQYLRY
jgi:8-oxo-dGTP pyrophosphatase MutT (NUDIX family)